MVVLARVGDSELLCHLLGVLVASTADSDQFGPFADAKGGGLRAAGEASPNQPDSNLLFLPPFSLCSRDI